MGQPMSDIPPVYGDNCLVGWDAGKTPKYVYVRFSNLVKCPDVPPHTFRQPPNDRVFKLTQSTSNPCYWFWWIRYWHVDWYVLGGPLRTWLILTLVYPFLRYFDDRPDGPVKEGYVYHNDFTACNPGEGAKGGIGVVIWTSITTDLLEAINLQKADDLFMEMRPLIDGNLVYKFCKLKDATNIAIELEPD